MVSVWSENIAKIRLHSWYLFGQVLGNSLGIRLQRLRQTDCPGIRIRPRQILGYFPAFYFEILWCALGYYIVIRMETQTEVRLLSPTVTPVNIGLVQAKIGLLSWSSHRENQANVRLRFWHPPTENQANTRLVLVFPSKN
jgi:hypothetical protein